MGIVFKAQHPVFGRGKKTQPVSRQVESPYYWWWQCLQRNEAYQVCCEKGGVGELNQLYQDFDDVLNDDFKAWWMKRGYYLFAENPKPVRLGELDSPDAWDRAWTKKEVMVVAVPLDIPKRDLTRFFAKLLKDRHGGERGKKHIANREASTARYPIYREVSYKTLQKQLAVYDAVMAGKRGEHKRTLAQIGVKLKLVEKAMPDVKDDVLDAAEKRNVMSATVSRYFRDAQRIIANTAKGQFPNSTKESVVSNDNSD